MPLTDNRQYRYPNSKAGPDLAAHLAALAQDVDRDVEAVLEGVLEGVDQALADPNLARSLPFFSASEDEAFLGDSKGRPSKVGFDTRGEIAAATVLSAHLKGVPLVWTGGTGLRIQDENGADSWLGWDETGAPDEIAKQAIINTLHQYTGPDRPFIWPGNYVVWTRTDPAGNPLETLIGRN